MDFDEIFRISRKTHDFMIRKTEYGLNASGFIPDCLGIPESSIQQIPQAPDLLEDWCLRPSCSAGQGLSDSNKAMGNLSARWSELQNSLITYILRPRRFVFSTKLFSRSMAI